MERKQKLLFGIGEVFEGAISDSIKPEVTVDLITRLKCKTMRLWLHNADILRLNEEGKPEFIPEKLKFYKKLIKQLMDGGVTHLTAMNHYYLYPKGFYASSWNVIPLPSGPDYLPFLELQTQCYKLLCGEFKEILYWEIGNEVNFDRFLAKPGYPLTDFHDEVYKQSLCYTEQEKADITLDICHYGSAGVKAGNPKAKVVAPSPAGVKERTAGFYELLYKGIAGGKAPRGKAPDTNNDSYFEILSWHPYTFDGNSEYLVEFCRHVYNTAEKYGHKNCRVFLTEFGYTDDDLLKFGITMSEADIRQAAYAVANYDAIDKELPFVETVHYFRLYDWPEGPGIEKTFGLFTAPSNPAGLIPKAKGLALYKFFNGASADIRGLYAHSNVNIQGDKS